MAGQLSRRLGKHHMSGISIIAVYKSFQYAAMVQKMWPMQTLLLQQALVAQRKSAAIMSVELPGYSKVGNSCSQKSAESENLVLDRSELWSWCISLQSLWNWCTIYAEFTGPWVALPPGTKYIVTRLCKIQAIWRMGSSGLSIAICGCRASLILASTNASFVSKSASLAHSCSDMQIRVHPLAWSRRRAILASASGLRGLLVVYLEACSICMENGTLSWFCYVAW